MLEDVNSAGLSFSLNMMPSADLTPLSPSEYKNSIPVTSIGEWTVANFATVDEVRDAISKGHFGSPVLKNLGCVYYTTYAPKSSSPTEAVNNLSHNMNRFDRIKNITVDANGGELGSSGKPVTEYTVWTSLSDLSNGEIFVRAYNGMNYKKYSIAQYKNSNKSVFSKIENINLSYA